MGTHIRLPFRPEFKAILLVGLKVATTRPKPYGKPGDTFSAFGINFILDGVIETTLEMVAFMYHRPEGFYSVEAFIKCWEKIHPKAGYQPLKKVYLHLFHKET